MTHTHCSLARCGHFLLCLLPSTLQLSLSLSWALVLIHLNGGHGTVTCIMGDCAVTTVKLSLEGLARKDPWGEAAVARLREAVIQMDELLRETWHLMHLDMRARFEAALEKGLEPDEPPWTVQRLRNYLCAVSGGGPAPNPEAAELVQVRQRLYDPLRGGLPLPSRKRLPGNAIAEALTLMRTAIATNIKEHFLKHQLRHIYLSHFYSGDHDGPPPAGQEQEWRARTRYAWEQARQRQREVNERGDSGDHSLPARIETSVAYDLAAHPERFLFPLWRMSRLSEERGRKKFAVLPLSQGFVPASCLHIDTASLLDLLGPAHKAFERYSGCKSDYDRRYKDRIAAAPAPPPGYRRNGRPPLGCYNDVESLDLKDQAWLPFFDWSRILPHQRSGDKRFGHHLTTDGTTVGIKVTCSPAGAFPAERPLPGFAPLADPAAPSSSRKRPAEEQGPRAVSAKQRQRAARQAAHDAALDGLLGAYPADQEGRAAFQGRIVGGDPGKHNLLFLTNARPNDGLSRSERKLDPNSRRLRYASPIALCCCILPKRCLPLPRLCRYTAAQRRHESGESRRRRKQEKALPEAIKLCNAALAQCDSRTPTLVDFQAYLRARFEVQGASYAYYRRTQHRAVRWHNFRGRRSSEDRFAQRVKAAFGSNAIVAYGNASGFHALPGLPPSPTVGLRRRLTARGLTVVGTPEPWTTHSCSRCGHLLREDWTRAREDPLTHRRRAPHGIRHCSSVPCGGPAGGLRWTRDYNAALNLKQNLVHRLRHGRWPDRRPPESAAAGGGGAMDQA
jgi:hypothetical protein